MNSQEFRRKFLRYFQVQGHTILPSSPVVPHDDPTLLFTNAGMNQFKDVFLGLSKRDYTRATTSQKCIRAGGKHNDLENVGHTSRHLTFFEMLGNFSFGDYSKKEAIGYAWDLVTHVWGFDPDKIWVSVYKDDDEAFALWEHHLSSKRIVRFGEEENFWAMGDVGPCGPCSELLYDRGERFGSAKNPYEDPSGERYFEFWNLVFMQYNRSPDGVMEPLPKPSIDTGAGLERVVSLALGVDTLFQTDVLRSLIAGVETISNVKYEGNPAFRVIADHIRSLSFAIADGAQPSNTDRGYVLRKILRRAVRYGRTIGLQRPFLAELFPRLAELMGDDYPELKANRTRIEEITTAEEEAFLRTLQRGGNLLSQVIERSRSAEKIAGDDAFILKDTYGLPLEEVQLIAKDEGLTIDLARFEQLEEEAKEKSRKARKQQVQQFDQNFFADFARVHTSQFEGYQHDRLEALLVGIVMGGQFVDQIQEGEEGILILDRTPFYPEKGGQIGDHGRIIHSASQFQVEDCISPYPGIIVHLGRLGKGSLKKGDRVQAEIDVERRSAIRNNHTATHLLHYVLHTILGPHIKQAGSLVEDKRFRFDYTHHKALSPQELRQIENLVNEKIRENRSVHTYEIPYREVQKRSDIQQFFEEKYGEVVRVVDIDYSKELCGGTHVASTGSIGLFKIIKEGSIAAGVRRIEAVTGLYAERWVQQQEDLLRFAAEKLKTSPLEVPKQIELLIEDHREVLHERNRLRKQQLHQMAMQFLDRKEKIGAIELIAEEVSLPAEDLTSFAEELIQQLNSGIVALGASFGERCQLLIQISPNVEIQAQTLIKEVAHFIKGGGGGKQTFAQAGGKDPHGLPKALAKIRELIKNVAR